MVSKARAPMRVLAELPVEIIVNRPVSAAAAARVRLSWSAQAASASTLLQPRVRSRRHGIRSHGGGP